MESIAIFMPEARDGHITIFQSIVETLAAFQSSVNVIVAGSSENLYDSDILPLDLHKKVELREIVYRPISLQYFTTLYGTPAYINSQYAQPFDNGYSLTDCDLWIFISSKVGNAMLPYAPIKPYIAYTPGFHEHYDISQHPNDLKNTYYDDKLMNYLFLRAAKKVLTTSEPAAQDALSVAGVHKNKIKKIPLTYKPIGIRQHKAKKRNGAILWCIDSSASSKFNQMQEILLSYYKECDGKKDTIICGTPNEKNYHFSGRKVDKRDPYWNGIKTFIDENELSSKVTLSQSLDGETFFKMMCDAPLLIHYRTSGPTPIILIDAGHAKLPVLSSDYPEARYAAELGGTAIRFMDDDGLKNREIASLIDETILKPPSPKAKKLMSKKQNASELSKIMEDVICNV